jgi:hypothetical protein
MPDEVQLPLKHLGWRSARYVCSPSPEAGPRCILFRVEG